MSLQPVRATDVELEDLVRKSDAVVIGDVHAKEVKWAAPPNAEVAPAIIVTDVTLRATDALKGDVGRDQEVTVRVLGGTIPEDDIGLMVSGQPNLDLNERVLLFLNEVPYTGHAAEPKSGGTALFTPVVHREAKLSISRERVRFRGQPIGMQDFTRRVREIEAAANPR
jgi:hypothetical protein